MFRIKKVLNHNVVIGVQEENQKECMIMEKGIGYGKKPGDKIAPNEYADIYSLHIERVTGDEIQNK